MTPKKRVEFERYKVVRPDWIVDCIKAGKTLPWSQYRLINRSSQNTIGIAQTFVDSYRAVSSRDEKIVYGGGGLQNELSQESSSYPTPPEMKAMDLDNVGVDVKEEVPKRPALEMKQDDEEMDIELPSDLSPIVISPSKPVEAWITAEFELPSTLSPLEISSPSIINTHDPISTRSHDQLEQKPPLRDPQTTKKGPSIEHPSTLSRLSPSNPPHQHNSDSFDQQKINPHDTATVSAAHNASILANPSLRSTTVLNPTFIKSYFDQSRLHHLSAWKADLKTQMQQLTSQNPPSRKSKKFSGPRWIMHVDFDCFFCSVSLVSRPELKEKPVCVGHGGAKSGDIASCNYPARKFGIHNGMRYTPSW